MTTAGGSEPHGRLPWFRPEDFTAEQREYYDGLLASPRDRAAVLDEQGRLNGPFNARILDPRIGTAIQRLGAVLRFDTPALTGRQRESSILEIARFEKSGYEWTSHSKAALAAGLSPAEIEAILQGTDLETFSAEELLTRRVIRTLLAERDLPDAVYAEATEGLGLVTVFDLVSLVGYYQHTALALRVWRVPDDGPFGHD